MADQALDQQPENLATPQGGGARARGPRIRPAPGAALRLKWIGIGLPIAFLVAIEVFRAIAIETDPLQRAEHVAIAAITGIGAVAFALFMFHMIERAERRIVRQNRELTAINAVSKAVQGELAVEQIIDAALHTVIDRTGATEASVAIFPHDGQPDSGLERTVVARAHASSAFVGSDLLHLIDIPLSRGVAVMGRMRLHLPEGVDEPDLVASATLQNIGHQLACSIQIGQLVADLQRRRLEGHGLYDVLLRISNQNPLVDTLTAVVRHARDLLRAEEAVLWLNGPTSAAVQPEMLDGSTALADGSLCISAEGDRFAVLQDRPLACTVRDPGGQQESMQVALTSPEGTLGDMWVGRGASTPFVARERGYLQTLGELASIAIMSARMRERERQGAILAERDRIAREMHDSLAQVLGVIHLRLRAVRAKAEVADDPAVTAELVELADLADEAYRDVREAILGLRESSRSDRGLLASLGAYLEKYGRQSGVRATLEAALDWEPRLSPRAEVQIIRVVQEALTNVRKHAEATSAVVRVSGDDGGVSFCIEDDGRGFDLARTLMDRDGGFGLHTMRERLDLIGGSLTIDSAPGHGTRVIARIPVVPLGGPPQSEVHGAHDGAAANGSGRAHAHPRPAG